MEILSVTYVLQSQILQAVIKFDYKGKPQHTVQAFKMEAFSISDMDKMQSDKLFMEACKAKVEQAKSILDNPEQDKE